MNYIQKFMKDNHIKTDERFKISRFPNLKFYFDDLYYLVVDDCEYIQKITDTKYIFWRLMTGACTITKLEGAE